MNGALQLWTSWILLLDLIYTAFLVPILVGFQVPDIGWGWGCIINLVAGASYGPNCARWLYAMAVHCCEFAQLFEVHRSAASAIYIYCIYKP